MNDFFDIGPVGASAKSPDRFDPAMIPVTEGKKMPIIIIAVEVKSAATQLNDLKSRPESKFPLFDDFKLLESLQG